MSALWKTLRIFISSTFRDMQAERDWLVRFVFPRLREALRDIRVRPVDVDLRWGLTSEQDVLEACHGIIDECRPRFLALLGERYGWIPEGDERSITEQEIDYAALSRPLQPSYHFFYYRDPEAIASIPPSMAREGGFLDRTESEEGDRLQELKERIRDAGYSPRTYTARWDAELERLAGLEDFGERVFTDLLASFRDDPELRPRFARDDLEAPHEQEEETAAMEAFVQGRIEHYVVGSRRPILDRLIRHVESDDGDSVLCLVGDPGSGKSALLGQLDHELRAKATVPDAAPRVIFSHFIGAGPGSDDPRRLLRRLCRELATSAAIDAEIPQDLAKLRALFPELLASVCERLGPRGRVAILIDALDQLSPAYRSETMEWLPDGLPAEVRQIFSSSPHPAVDALSARSPPPERVTLPRLEISDAETLIDRFLERYRKRVGAGQRAALLDKPQALNPLYLVVALEELRTLGRYGEISDRIEELPGDTRDLFAWILRRLQNDPIFRGSGQTPGQELVTGLASFLAASRSGLTEPELWDLLASEGDPEGNLAALLRLLRPYLMDRGELLDFYHNQLREAAIEELLPSDRRAAEIHTILGRFFRERADPRGDSSWQGAEARPLTELPHHLTRAGSWQSLARTLTDWRFFHTAARLGLGEILSREYALCLDEMSRFPGSIDLASRIGVALAERYAATVGPRSAGPSSATDLPRAVGALDRRLLDVEIATGRSPDPAGATVTAAATALALAADFPDSAEDFYALALGRFEAQQSHGDRRSVPAAALAVAAGALDPEAVDHLARTAVTIAFSVTDVTARWRELIATLETLSTAGAATASAVGEALDRLAAPLTETDLRRVYGPFVGLHGQSWTERFAREQQTRIRKQIARRIRRLTSERRSAPPGARPLVTALLLLQAARAAGSPASEDPVYGVLRQLALDLGEDGREVLDRLDQAAGGGDVSPITTWSLGSESYSVADSGTLLWRSPRGFGADEQRDPETLASPWLDNRLAQVIELDLAEWPGVWELPFHAEMDRLLHTLAQIAAVSLADPVAAKAGYRWYRKAWVGRQRKAPPGQSLLSKLPSTLRQIDRVVHRIGNDPAWAPPSSRHRLVSPAHHLRGMFAFVRLLRQDDLAEALRLAQRFRFSQDCVLAVLGSVIATKDAACRHTLYLQAAKQMQNASAHAAEGLLAMIVRAENQCTKDRDTQLLIELGQLLEWLRPWPVTHGVAPSVPIQTPEDST